MNKTFWRPFLIFGSCLIILAVFARLIPIWDNKLIPIKKLDLVQSLIDSFKPSGADSLEQMVTMLHVPSELTPLQSFFDQLDSAKKNGNGNIRVAYFGDSIIEGDLISGKLREQLQAQYGGSGVGLVPITSIVNEFRKTIRHSFSKNWETQSFMNRGSSAPLGMIGYTFIPRNYYFAESVIEAEPQPAVDSLLADSTSSVPVPSAPKKETRRFYMDGPSWVEYGGVSAAGGATDLRQIRLFYSHATSSSSVSVSYDGGAIKTFYLQSGQSVQVLNLGTGSPLKKIRLDFNPLDPIHLYGLSFDDNQGVYVDNLSVRGFSGMYFNAIPSGHLSSFQSSLGFDLIILQYGENVSSPELRNYDFYKKGMTKTVKHIQSAMPGVPILILSAHDRSIKQNGVYQTSPDIPILVNAQGEVARENNCAFWNVFDAMGGLNSMPGYVKSKPALANLDYTHFTLAGANKIAGMLYAILTKGVSN